jgi:hypothetical protein
MKEKMSCSKLFLEWLPDNNLKAKFENSFTFNKKICPFILQTWQHCQMSSYAYLDR